MSVNSKEIGRGLNGRDNVETLTVMSRAEFRTAYWWRPVSCQWRCHCRIL